MSPASKSELLKLRATFFKHIRHFFEAKGVLEVDTPLLSRFAPIDTHIDLFETSDGYFLHSSPEYGMKRLLAQGSGDIYQLSHVYRREELGRIHRQEFTLLEWYRIDTHFPLFLQETLELLYVFLGPQPHEVIPYATAFSQALEIPYTAPIEVLQHAAQRHGLECRETDPQALRNILWGCCVEPQLGHQKISVITDYPSDQAALARIKQGTAERFELYFKGIELGNGYHELTDPIEQQQRLETHNRARIELGKPALPIDPHFLTALETGLPNCYGIAVGIDRLLMLHTGAPSISHVLPIDGDDSH